jgi:hypothetical protein
MAHATGIELGPDYCVLVAARRRQASAELPAVRVLTAAEWGTDPKDRSERLRAIRADFRFPRDCAVVHWGNLDSRTFDSPLQALAEAGFRVHHVCSPTEALLSLARVTPRPEGSGAVAWLALNTNGAAIVVVLDGSVIYAREFGWTIAAPAERSQAHLLRRYLRLAQVAPELRRAIQTVRATDGVAVETAITCGNLPDLRSLTMPLISEVNVEVETLDSTAGLDFGDRTSDFHELAPVIRLAAAVAMTAPDRDRVRGGARFTAAAAATLLVAVVVWWSYSQRSPSSPANSAGRPDAPGDVVALQSGPGEVPEVASSRGTGSPRIPAGESAEPRPAERAPDATTAPQPRRPPEEAAATSGRLARQKPGSDPNLTPHSDRLPTVDGILISPRLRLAVLDGVIVGVGDTVGGRRVSRIDADAVVLSDSTGRDVRLPVRARSRGL